MQHYQTEPLPIAADRVPSALSWSFIDLLEPLLLLGVGPLVLAPERFPPKTILLGLAVLLIPYLLRWIFYGAPSTSTLADLPLVLLFGVMTPVAVWVTPYFWDKTWPELVRMLWGGAVFMGVINWAWPVWQTNEPEATNRYRLPVRLRLLTFAYLGLGIGLTVVGLLNMQVANKLPLVDVLARRVLHVNLPQAKLSTLAADDQFNPNRVASLLVLCAPLPLAFLLASGRSTASTAEEEAVEADGTGQLGLAFLGLMGVTLWRVVRKFFWVGLWLLFAGGLLLTQSRAGLLALAVAALCIVVLTGRRPDGLLRLAGGLLVLLFLLGMSYFALDLQYNNLLPGLLATGATLEQNSAKATNTATLSGRTIIWERALHSLADQPLTGIGLGAFDQIAREPYPLPGFIPGEIHHAHNLFLQTGLDLGVPGMIGFLALVVIAVGSVLRLYRRVSTAGEISVWAIALLGCCSAFLIDNTLDGLTLGARPAVAMWFLLALATVAGKYS